MSAPFRTCETYSTHVSHGLTRDCCSPNVVILAGGIAGGSVVLQSRSATWSANCWTRWCSASLACASANTPLMLRGSARSEGSEARTAACRRPDHPSDSTGLHHPGLSGHRGASGGGAGGCQVLLAVPSGFRCMGAASRASPLVPPPRPLPGATNVCHLPSAFHLPDAPSSASSSARWFPACSW